MPLCDYQKCLKNDAMYSIMKHRNNNHSITGTALLINKTDFVVIDVDNKG